jgi:hypothetical protein
MRYLTALIGGVLIPVAAHAHPAEGGVGLIHYITDPSHIAPGVLTAGALILAIAVWRAARRRTAVAHQSH